MYVFLRTHLISAPHRRVPKEPIGYVHMCIDAESWMNTHLRRSKIEFLTGCTGGSPANCAKQLWNFAFAGSDIDAALCVSCQSLNILR